MQKTYSSEYNCQVEVVALSSYEEKEEQFKEQVCFHSAQAKSRFNFLAICDIELIEFQFIPLIIPVQIFHYQLDYCDGFFIFECRCIIFVFSWGSYLN